MRFVGGSILDASDVMVGSILIVDFPRAKHLEGWLSADPYMTSGVWLDAPVEGSPVSDLPRGTGGSRRMRVCQTRLGSDSAAR